MTQASVPELISAHLESLLFAPPFRQIDDRDFGSLWLIQSGRAVFADGSDFEPRSLPRLVQWAGVIPGGKRPDRLLTIGCEDRESNRVGGWRYIPHDALRLEVDRPQRALINQVISDFDATWEAALKVFKDLPPPQEVSDLSSFRVHTVYLGGRNGELLLVGDVAGFRLEWFFTGDGKLHFGEFGD